MLINATKDLGAMIAAQVKQRFGPGVGEFTAVRPLGVFRVWLHGKLLNRSRMESC